MAEVRGVGTEILTALAYPPITDCPKAGEIITSVRDMIPDPMYDDVTGDPLPDADGSFLRASTLYRWLTAGIRELTRRANWVVQDWTAAPQVTRQQIIGFNHRWTNLDGCFCNQYRLIHLDELHTIYPSYSVAQPLWFSMHSRGDHLELSLWPAPDRTDPAPALMSSMDPVSDSIEVASTTGFLPFGFALIEHEMIQYSTVEPASSPTTYPRLRTIRRGVGGTVAITHFAGVPVQHLGVWLRGWRMPIDVTEARHCVELPYAFQHPLEVFVLAKAKEAEQDRQGAASLMQEFREATDSILNDPVWQQPPFPMQAAAYGSSPVGGLAYGRVIVP